MLSQSKLKEYLDYNPNTGKFTWLVDRVNNKLIRKEAGYLKSTGYRVIKLDYTGFYAHRLAFLYMEGKMPEQVDHINHICDDNRFINLRPANHLVNNRNRKLEKRNKTGIPGVRWYEKSQHWKCQIQVKRKCIYLGVFNDFFEACCSQKSAQNKYNFHNNHGASE